MSASHQPLTIVQGNLLDAPEKYIAHQCNCVSPQGKGLSHALFQRFPHADVYATRKGKSQPGTLWISPVGNGERRVINMFAQFYPGAPTYRGDLAEDRKVMFQRCLNEIANLPSLESIAFPYNIGCGLAGGKWADYLAMLTQFAAELPAVKVTLYKL